MSEQLKKCNGPCKEEKSQLEFSKNINNKDGFAWMCKQCFHDYFSKNREKVLKQSKDWYNNNTEKAKIKTLEQSLEIDTIKRYALAGRTQEEAIDSFCGLRENEKFKNFTVNSNPTIF